MKTFIEVPRWLAILVFAVFILLLGALVGTSLVSVQDDRGTVVGFMVGTVDNEPISRWYAIVETDLGERLIEIGPGLYSLECFQIGDRYEPGSVGRCEDVVWP